MFSRRKKDVKSLKELFIECSLLTKEAFNSLKDAVIAYTNGNFTEAYENADKTIEFEKKQDRVKEEIFERIYSRETMVFSRSDRIQIIENIDKITDKVEIVVRKLGLREVEIDKNLRAGIVEVAELCDQIGSQVHEMTINLLEDFEKAQGNITQITNLRREVREKQWELQKLNYEYQKDFQVFRYTESLIKYLMEAADRAEIFADRMFILIHKYTN